MGVRHILAISAAAAFCEDKVLSLQSDSAGSHQHHAPSPEPGLNLGPFQAGVRSSYP